MSTHLEPIPTGRGGATASATAIAAQGGHHAVSDAALETTASNVKRLRLAAEADVKYLENRLAKLRAEEAAALKEIERTRQQTAEFLADRKAHENREKSRRDEARRKEAERKREAALLALRKEKQLQRVWSAKASLLQQRRDAAEALQRDSEMNKCRVRIEKEDTRSKARATRTIVQAQADAAREKRRKEEEERKLAARKALEERVDEDTKARQAMEAQTSSLVQEEAELIYRLKRMHMAKHKAVKQLALVMRITAAERQTTDAANLEDAVRAETERARDASRPVVLPVRAASHDPDERAARSVAAGSRRAYGSDDDAYGGGAAAAAEY